MVAGEKRLVRKDDNFVGKVKVESEAGKIVNEKYLGEIVELGRYVEIDPSRLLWSEIVDDFEIEDVARFRKTLAKAEKTARSMK